MSSLIESIYARSAERPFPTYEHISATDAKRYGLPIAAVRFMNLVGDRYLRFMAWNYANNKFPAGSLRHASACRRDGISFLEGVWLEVKDGHSAPHEGLLEEVEKGSVPFAEYLRANIDSIDSNDVANDVAGLVLFLLLECVMVLSREYAAAGYRSPDGIETNPSLRKLLIDAIFDGVKKWMTK